MGIKDVYNWCCHVYFQYIGGYKNSYITPTLCFMLLDEAAIFWETTESCTFGLYLFFCLSVFPCVYLFVCVFLCVCFFICQLIRFYVQFVLVFMRAKSVFFFHFSHAPLYRVKSWNHSLGNFNLNPGLRIRMDFTGIRPLRKNTYLDPNFAKNRIWSYISHMHNIINTAL